MKAYLIMAERDAYAGRPPPALIHLPQDNLFATLQRFFRWDGRPMP
jgi:hypothetical protein